MNHNAFQAMLATLKERSASDTFTQMLDTISKISAIKAKEQEAIGNNNILPKG